MIHYPISWERFDCENGGSCQCRDNACAALTRRQPTARLAGAHNGHERHKLESQILFPHNRKFLNFMPNTAPLSMIDVYLPSSKPYNEELDNLHERSLLYGAVGKTQTRNANYWCPCRRQTKTLFWGAHPCTRQCHTMVVGEEVAQNTQKKAENFFGRFLSLFPLPP